MTTLRTFDCFVSDLTDAKYNPGGRLIDSHNISLYSFCMITEINLENAFTLNDVLVSGYNGSVLNITTYECSE